MKRWIWVLPILLAASLVAAQDRSQRAVEWTHYGGDPGGTRHSTLTDINAGNVRQLQPAWQWKHWETPLKEYDTVPGQFEATPLMIDGTLYVTTPYNSIAALDAETGKGPVGQEIMGAGRVGGGCRVERLVPEAERQEQCRAEDAQPDRRSRRACRHDHGSSARRGK